MKRTLKWLMSIALVLTLCVLIFPALTTEANAADDEQQKTDDTGNGTQYIAPVDADAETHSAKDQTTQTQEQHRHSVLTLIQYDLVHNETSLWFISVSI